MANEDEESTDAISTHGSDEPKNVTLQTRKREETTFPLGSRVIPAAGGAREARRSSCSHAHAGDPWG